MVKALCAYSVVLLHIHFPGTAGNIANVLARFAVPVFFMVSGYFCYRGDETEFIRTGRKIRHVLLLIVVAFPVCALWDVVQNHIEGGSQRKWLEELFSGESIRQFFLYNNSSQVKWHLWFLPALLYCYLLFALTAKLRLYKQAYILIPVLLMIHFCMEEFSPYLGEHFRVMQFRNYLFTGFPFFMSGHFLHKYQQKISEYLSGKNAVYFCMVVAAGAICSLVEYRYFGKQELMLGSVIMAVGIFLFAMLKPDAGIPGRMAEIGQKYAFFIYLFHLCVADILKDIFQLTGLQKNAICLWMKPIMVCILVTAAAAIYFMVFSYLKSVILHKNMLKYPLSVSGVNENTEDKGAVSYGFTEQSRSQR